MTSKESDVSGGVDPDVKRRLLSVCDTLENAGSQAFPIDFHGLAADIRAVLSPLPSPGVERLRDRVRLLLDWDFGDESNHCIALAEASAALLSALPLDGGGCD